MHKSVRMLALCLGALLMPSWICAQVQLGVLTGTVYDVSGGVIPQAEIEITNTETGIRSVVKTSTAGYYRVSVPPGPYDLDTHKEGFKVSVAKHIVVAVAQVETIDITLQVGDASQSITVTTEAPLLTTSTADVGASFTPQEFQTLPIPLDDGGRQPQSFIFRSLPGAVGDEYQGSLNGGQQFSHQILIDGVTIGRYDMSGGSMAEYSPGTDSIGEFKVEMTNYSAEYGDTGGAIVNFSMKSGTNQFHGTAFEYNKNPVFNAAGLVVNANPGSIKDNEKENNFGGTLGGPIRKDKTFFFASFEGDRFTNFSYGSATTIPTEAMRAGDFSSFLGDQIGTDALGRPVYQNEIYDPTTTRVVGGQVVRDPFQYNGQLNVIPPGEFSTSTSVLLPLFADPMFSGNKRNTLRIGPSTPVLRRDAVNVKIDHAIGSNHKISGMFGYYRRFLWKRNTSDSAYPPFPGQPISTFKNQEVVGPQARLSYNWTINSHSINNFVVAYNRTNNANNLTDNAKYTPKLGIAGIPNNCFPRFSFKNTNTNIQFMSALGVGCANIDPSESYVYQDTYSNVRGKHSLKFGADFIRYRYNTNEPGALSGTFTFHNTETALPGFTSATGHPFASFILGGADAASRTVYATEPGYRAGEISFFALDDWRATSKLTLNVGLRWQIPLPKTEAFNRQSGFDPTLPNPGADDIPGALAFLGSCSVCIHRNSFQDWYFKEVAPRLGLAYQISKNMVLRAGYGISYGPPILNNFGSQNIYGFDSSVVVHHPAGTAGKFDPVTYLSPLATAALPAGARVGLPAFTGTLPNTDPAQANGDSLDYLPQNSLAQPYVQNWSAGFQYQLPHEVLIEANYVGSKGTRLLDSNFATDFNQVNSKFMGLGDNLDMDFQDALNAGILQPYGVTTLPYPSFEDGNNCGTTVANGLAPHPQYCGLTNNYPTMGKSTYNALQLTARKNSTHGLTFIAAYTLSKTITDTDTALYYPSYAVQDFYNRRLEKSIASFDHPQSLKLTWIYSLPFGNGQKYLSSTGKLDRLFSGWQIAAIQQYLSGDPLYISSSLGTIINPGLRADVISGVAQTVPLKGLDVINGTPYLNPAAFADPPSSPSSGYPLRIGTSPRYLPNVRGPAHENEDIGIIKTTKINERISFQIRADMFNVFNRTGRGNPDTSLGDGYPADGGTFGLVLDPMNGPRIIQFAARVNF